MYLRASNGVYFEVGGTTTNIGVIKDGRPAIDYSVVGGHRTYISSLDLDKIMMLMEVEMQMIDPGDDVIIVGAKNSL